MGAGSCWYPLTAAYGSTDTERRLGAGDPRAAGAAAPEVTELTEKARGQLGQRLAGVRGVL